MTKWNRVAYMDAVRGTIELSDAAVRLVFVLLKYADQHGRCYPSQARMADDCGWSVAKLKRTVRELRTAGFVTYLERAKHKRGRSLIALTIPSTGVRADTGTGADTGVTADPEPVSSVNGTGVTGDTRNSPRELTQGTHPGEDSPEGSEGQTKPDPWTVFLAGLPSPAAKAIEADRCHIEKLQDAVKAAKAAGRSAASAARAVGQGPDVAEANHPAAMAAKAVTEAARRAA